jgi:imidazolonepropionase-like amidohydrolase
MSSIKFHKPLYFQIEIIQNGTVIVDDNGVIVDIGRDDILNQKYEKAVFIEDIDATGKSVVPGDVQIRF